MAAVKYTAEEDHILMDGVALYNPFQNPQPSPTEDTSTPPPKGRPTPDIASILQMKMDDDKRSRDAAKLEDTEREKRRREEFDLLRADAAEDRELRREELKLWSRELELRELQEEENKKERQLMIQLLTQLINK